MNANDYRKLAGRTLIPAPDFQIESDEVMISWNALGLAGETGEVCDLIKKGIYHQHGLDSDKMKKELGDVAWYLSALCTNFGFTLDDVLQANVDKLIIRYPDGYTVEESKDRKDLK